MSQRKGYQFFPPLPGHFIHGVDLRDWYPCWNIALTGRLSSPDYFASVIEPGFTATHKPIRDTPIEMLRNRGFAGGLPTPRAVWTVWAAAIVRHGGRVGIGMTNTEWFTREEGEDYCSRGDIEIAFEEGRRTICPNAPSRLSSLYLAEDSGAGRTHVHAMLGRNIHILRVTVPVAVRACRVDSGWFDLYCNDPNPIYIQSYWQSVPAGLDSTNWEILIDGMIQIDDPIGLAHLIKFGAHLEIDKTGFFQKELERNEDHP